jgi:hypothetical protein
MMLTAVDSAVILIDAAKGLPMLREPRDGRDRLQADRGKHCRVADYYSAEDSAASCGA